MSVETSPVSPGVACLGIMVDPVRRMPDPGRLVLVDEMQLHTGGCAVNVVTVLARL